MDRLTLDSLIINLGLSNEHVRGLSVERVGRVWISQQLREELLKNVDHI